MPRTIHIDGVDDDTYAALARRPAVVGKTAPEFVRIELTRRGARRSVAVRLQGTRRRSTPAQSRTP